MIGKILVLALLKTFIGAILPSLNEFFVGLQNNRNHLTYKLEPRIAYGQPVDNIAEYPFFAGLDGCGGAIISEEWVVTAAHCLPCSVGYYVTVGGNNIESSKIVRIEDVIIHPNYTTAAYGVMLNDIALIKLATPLKFSSRIKPLNLPEKNKDFEFGSRHVFIGKGQDETRKPSKDLMKIDVYAYPTEDCYRVTLPLYHWLYGSLIPILNETTICSVRVENLPGAGYGDSGSPMVRGNTLVGIASYIVVPENGRLLFATKVAHYVPWIKSVIEEMDKGSNYNTINSH